jgi:flagellar biosynthesis protein FlhF
MNIRKFSADTSREAIRLVRQALGSDAVVLSNRLVDGKVEILAMADGAANSLADLSHSTPKVPVTAQFTPRVVAELKPVQTHQAPRPVPAAVAPAPVAVPAPVTIKATAPSEMFEFMTEIRSMRGMLQSQFSELSWTNTQKREPQKIEILKEMLATGLSASLSRHLLDKMPESEVATNGMNWIKSILAHNLSTISNESEILEKGGVYALVGPTGVGKTTTTAKLAARCVMRHGPGKLALITTDGYRIGGYEQLRIYGKILGVMVHSVKDEADLRIALAELKDKHTVLIDTVGVGQRDKMVTEQVAMLSGAGTNVKRLLCLNATSTGETLSEVVRAYQGSGLAGCILTKLDEAATIGGALDIAIRQKLNIYYVASGQRVPEDLHIANKQYLVDRAFKLKRETAAFKFQDDELPILMANAPIYGAGNAIRNKKEVSLG